MPEYQPKPIPASRPLLVFIISLAIAPALPYADAVVGGILVCALLAIGVRRISLAVMFLTMASGFFVGISHEAAGTQAAELAASLPSQRFVTVEITAVRSWEQGFEDTMRVRAPEFRILRPRSKPIDVSESITISVDGTPEPFGRSEILTAEGFLSRSEGRWFLRVKSVELLRQSGRIHEIDPRFWNRRISERIDAVTTHATAEPLALARALVLGQSDRLPDALRASYIDGGTYHLLVFSGLQIGIAAGFLAWCLRIFRRPLLSDVALIVMAVLAPLFAGNEPSVTRASLMIGVWAGARAAGRPTLRANLLFVACGLRLAMHPEELGDPGFALTFGATAGLAVLGPALARAMGVESAGMRAACAGFCAEVAVLPITLYFFGRCVFGGWVVTMLVSPLIVVLLALSAVTCAASTVCPELVPELCRGIVLLDEICRRANAVVDQDLRLAGVALPPPIHIMVFVYAASLILIPMRRNGARVAVIVLLLIPTSWALILTHTRELPPGESITAIDVGQGDAYLLSDGATTLLVDGGGRRGDARFGQRVLVPQLLELGARRIDVVAMSHPHPDHCGGLPSVVLRLEVGEVWMSGRHLYDPCAQELFEAAIRRRVPVVILEKNERDRIGAIGIETILPRLRYKKSPLNNGSVVLVAKMKRASMLLTGDIESDAEFVLTDDGIPLRATVLKVPHHGSRSSSSEALLAAAGASWALISSGAGNPYGHPGDEVLARLQRHGMRIIRTDRDGTTSLVFGPHGPEVHRRLPR